MRSYTNVIFDLDGTLLNTEAGIVKSLCAMTQKVGLPNIPLFDCSRFIGPPIERGLCDYFRLTNEEAEKYAIVFRDIYRNNFLFEASLYEGIIELLKCLSGREIELAIATYKRHDYAKEVIEHFGLNRYCTPCYGSDSVILKTKSDIIKKCISEMHVAEDSIVYVGDTIHDLQGAHEAGIDFIGVSWGFGFNIATANYGIQLARSTDDLFCKILGGAIND
ncbi:phosphoglycolate phosphatase [Clostridia bacterium]|nr:phosphoglycolate phosphatase [Clostridia bacterium]GHV34702.1 phosphoglycolate phosphatase [Clostridia bacterium]